ncbi:MAG: hypothetical protein RQ824_12355 [bacterium]|nr:hypothetical protein [bacterium]
MQKKIFLSQGMLDKLSSEGKLELSGDKLTIQSNDHPEYIITPAAKFLGIESKDADPHKLIGKIIPLKILKDKGVELYMDSAIYKDEAYNVEQGFVGILVEEKGGKQVAPQPVQEVNTEEVPKGDEELLADFFLKNL